MRAVFGMYSMFANKRISNVSHKAKGLDRDRYRKQKRIVAARQLPSGEKQCFSVLREARSNGRVFVIGIERVSSYLS
jgi:hypothetical protein